MRSSGECGTLSSEGDMPRDSGMGNDKFAREVSEFMGSCRARLNEGEDRMTRIEESAAAIRTSVNEIKTENQSVRLTIARWAGAFIVIGLVIVPILSALARRLIP